MLARQQYQRIMFVTFLHILKGFRKHIGEVSLGNGIGNPFADTVNYLFFYLFKQIINIQELFIEGYTVVARPAGELRNGDFFHGLSLVYLAERFDEGLSRCARCR